MEGMDPKARLESVCRGAFAQLHPGGDEALDVTPCGGGVDVCSVGGHRGGDGEDPLESLGADPSRGGPIAGAPVDDLGDRSGRDARELRDLLVADTGGGQLGEVAAGGFGVDVGGLYPVGEHAHVVAVSDGARFASALVQRVPGVGAVGAPCAHGAVVAFERGEDVGADAHAASPSSFVTSRVVNGSTPDAPSTRATEARHSSSVTGRSCPAG